MCDIRITHIHTNVPWNKGLWVTQALRQSKALTESISFT
jgi:hypothetical protein